MNTIYDLPAPGRDDLERSKALSDFIRQEINAHDGKVSFETFMDLALYHPAYGYYNSPSFNLGQHGDFTTAPEISPLFAQCFAQQVRQIASHMGNYSLLEAGAGSGRFACDLLSSLNKLGCLPDQYVICELSLPLREKQRALLQNRCPELAPLVIWLDAPPAGFKGVMIANEVLDALPVHRFRVCENTIHELYVGYENNAFVWRQGEPSSPLLAENLSALQQAYAFSNGYESELNLRMLPFIQKLADALDTGVLLFADYGYGQMEYYHPERRRGTLTGFYQHHRLDNPLILPGLQDLTAHVDFTRVIDCASDYGCDLYGYTSQAAFLMANGLLTFASDEEKSLSPQEEFKLHHAIKILTLPSEMGERVKVMALGKNLAFRLSGFELQDRRREL